MVFPRPPERAMSVSASKQRSLVLAIGIMATAAIAACDSSPTQPSQLSRLQLQPRAIEGDTLQCAYGWVVVAGRYVCNEES